MMLFIHFFFFPIIALVLLIIIFKLILFVIFMLRSFISLAALFMFMALALRINSYICLSTKGVQK